MGEKQQNAKNGFGTLYYPDGGQYKGQWKDDQIHGKGTLYYSDGKPAYEGDWVFGNIQGMGTLYNQNPLPLPAYFDGRNFDLADEFALH